MKILGIDTATDICGIALTENNRLITEYRSNFKRAHAEKLIDSIAAVLDDADVSLKDLDAIAISIGPGSFTGLRIGLSTVKGIAFAHKLPVVSVITLDALAYQAIFWTETICPLIKAQANEAYAAFYKVKNFVLERISDFQLIILEELKHLIKQKTLILNNGLNNLNDFICQQDNKQIFVAPEDISLLNGLTIAQLGYDKFQKGQIEHIETLEPFYLKEFKVKQRIEYKL